MKKSRKILIDAAIFGLQKAGGISKVFSEILQGLDEMFPGQVIVLMPKNKNIEIPSLLSHLKKVRIVSRKRPCRIFFLESCYLTLLAWKYRPSIWHSSYYVGFPFFGGGVKVITFHDMMGEIFNINSFKETKAKFLTLKKSHRIFAISEHAASDLKKYWPQFRDKIHVVKNGLNLMEVFKKETKIPYLIYVGRRRGYKNFLPSIKIILQDSAFQEMSIYVVGGEESLTDEEKKLERVKWFKTLPSQELNMLIKGAEALLFPSLYEGFGLPLLEAFHYEIPVLAFRVSCIPEIVGKDYPLADPENFDSLSATLVKLLKEKAQWIDYGRERKKLFSREKMIYSLLQHYEAL